MFLQVLVCSFLGVNYAVMYSGVSSVCLSINRVCIVSITLPEEGPDTTAETSLPKDTGVCDVF